ncbi:MAG: chaperonin GroEL [Anaerolineae bacterium]|nr:chaperonin GroEL [Anaerolineae bacterium]
MAKKKNRWQPAKVVFQPETHQGMQRGIDQIVNAIRPTLGPLPRVVLYDTTVGATGRLPELLDDGGTIARRIVQIADRDADMGAMLLRHTLWRQHEDVGDGTATAAVIFQAVYNEGRRYLASGGDAMQLRGYLEQGMRLLLEELAQMTFYLEGKMQLARLAETICYRSDLSKLLGEIFDIIGAYGRLEIRSARGREMEREYVEGMYWEGGLLSRSMINNQERQRAELENPVILMTDLEIEDPRDLIPVLGTCVGSNMENLLIIARKFSESVMAMLLSNQKQGRLKVNIVGVKTPGVSVDAQRDALIDLASLTGGHPLLKATGVTARSFRPQDLGRARRIWADKNNVGIIGARGDPRQLRQHIADLRAIYDTITDPQDRARMQQRIGTLMGGSATLWVTGMTKTELEFNKELVKRTAEAMRGAIREGVIPGGGVALLACRSVLAARVAQCTDVDERAAYRILLTAVEAPTRALLENVGLEPGMVFADLNSAGPGYGFDVQCQEIVDMAEAGIYDAVTVVQSAVRSGVAGAAMALTTDVLVHRPGAPESLTT